MTIDYRNCLMSLYSVRTINTLTKDQAAERPSIDNWEEKG